MATQQTDNWSLELRDANVWSDLLRLQRDLHVTRATLKLPPSPGDADMWLGLKVNNGPETVMCQLGNFGGYPMKKTLDVVFKAGDSVSFKVNWWYTIGPCAVSVEGCFKQEPVFVAPASTRSTLDSSDGGRSAAEEISRQLQVTGKLLVGEMATTSARLLEHMSSHEDRTAERMSCLETILTKQLTEINTQNAELVKLMNLMNVTQRRTVDKLEANLSDLVEEKKALEEQLTFCRLKTKELEARDFNLDKKLATLK